MAGSGGRNLDETPTWAVATVCFVLLSVSIIIEYIFNLIGKKWLKQKNKRALYESLEKIKSELMLLGFISLLLTIGQGLISRICISENVAGTFHPCNHRREEKNYPPPLEDDYYHHNRHILAAEAGYDKQFVRSVPKVDYLTLRHGFMMAHLGPHSHQKFDFRKYIKRSLEEDFKVVVEISPPIWFITVFFLLFNTHGWYSYLWLPFAPLIIVLLVGMKLQVIITKMGQRIQERGEVVRGMPLVQPGDHLFWFNKPRLILYLINFVLFQNAFQLAFFSWAALQFMMKSCFLSQKQDVVIRISMGIFVQFLCSYVTLPLYALVTQMGSTMKATIFNERVAMALRNWHHTAKKNIKEKRGLRSQSPLSTRPSTPKHPKSKANLLRRYHSEMATYPSSPIRFDFEAHLPYEIHSPPSSKVNAAATSSIDQHEMEMEVEMEIDMDQVSDLAQHQIDIEDKQEFSFDKR
ncbi:hypothetical protein LR48_Vigan05g181600 [Vigna angularis]|uniref:MLO-like protein n=1 Tax=Phaseolus angularis TaxID=3914 RepID=A0A0L9UNC1_PHAAN|nr:hypothetical protein LR48_Vigan05g181600 [Vigna angularis]